MEEIKIKKIYRSRRRSIALEVTSQAELIVRAPFTIPESRIFYFINLKRAWILVKQKFMQDRLGKRKKLEVLHNEEVIKERCKFFAQKMGLRYKSIKINNAKKRLGSCSSSNSINFSRRLTMTPLSVIDYVVVHELCHIEVKNHSKRFWKKVKTWLPDYSEQKKWLKENLVD